MSGTISDYKACTTVFVEWIISTATIINKQSKKLPNTLACLISRADIICKFKCENGLPPFLTDENCLPKCDSILRMGKRAINLRTQVNTAFIQRAVYQCENVSDSDLSHSHCINVLLYCHKGILNWYNSLIEQLSLNDIQDEESNDINYQQSNSNRNRDTNSNRYIILSDDDMNDENIDDIYNSQPNANDEIDINIDSSNYKDVTIDSIDKNIDPLRLTTICFILDIQKVFNKIESCWKMVAKDEVDILEATAMTIMGLRSLDSINAEMQTQFPSMTNAADFLIATAREYVDIDAIGDCSLSRFYKDMIRIFNILNNFRDLILIKHNGFNLLMYDRNVNSNEQFASDYSDLTVYIEQFSKSFPIDNNIFIENFFFGELVTLYNSFYESDDSLFESFPIMKCILMEFIEYFRKKTINMSLIFRCLSWLTIVHSLCSNITLAMGRTLCVLRQSTHRFHSL